MLRNSVLSLTTRLFCQRQVRELPSQEISEGAKSLAASLRARETEGMQTTIRDLTAICQGDQFVALRLLNQLKELGIVQIEDSLHDAFESSVHLTERALAHTVDPDKIQE